MTVAWYDGVTVELSIDMVHGPGSNPSAYTDFSSRLRGGITLNRGRSSERDSMQVGSITFTLDNSDGAFNPDNTSGSYYPNVKPMRWCRLRVTYSATTYTLFTGFVQGWPQTWELSDHDATVTITAHDAMKLAGRALMAESEWLYQNTGASASITGPYALYRLGEEDGAAVCVDTKATRDGVYMSAGQTRADGLIYGSTNGARQIVGGGLPSNALVADMLQATPTGTDFTWDCWLTIPSTGYGNSKQYLWIQNDYGAIGIWWEGSLAGIGENTPFIATGSAWMMVYLDNSLKQIGMKCFSPGHTVPPATRTWDVSTKYDDATHHLCLVRTGSGFSLYVDGVAASSGSSSGSIGAGSTTFGTYATIGPFHEGTYVMDEVGVFSTSLNSTAAAARYAMGSAPGAGEVVSARLNRVKVASQLGVSAFGGDTSVIPVQAADYGGGSTNVLSMMQTLEATEQGRVFVAGDGTWTFHSWAHGFAASVEAAFSDNSATVMYAQAAPEFDDLRVINSATVSRDNGVDQNIEDPTSITAYGRMSGGISGALYISDAYSLSFAQYMLGRYKDPESRLRSLTVLPRRAPATLFPIVLSVDVGSKITFRRQPPGSAAYTRTLFVEGVTHTFDINGTWTTEYLTSLADWAGTVAIWDSGTAWDSAKWGV